ncbi:uncharacterized protein G2W53_008183 [Senna tora]|uniref:Uncharacterized protein n=1 Tax=Senna tora TaxID=362788 RepID=A0A835CFK8_9FABA|nr:uncharacterized protein G2W53_008183 [Senna tora]
MEKKNEENRKWKKEDGEKVIEWRKEERFPR